ncbi:6-phosphogluconolactonase, partial [Leucobacter sp. M11]|uniref:6-phosphogluconolactonase n=1 Tax=Leucobacter sp. M11 TaxID=2993565 RepID=UPI002D7E3BA1
MTPVPRLVTAADAAALAERIAHDLLAFLADRLSSQDEVTVALTGGGMGIGCLRALARLPEREAIDWTRVRLIWGDERWLPLGDPERNETQAREALLDALPLLRDRVIAMPASDEGFDLDEAAEELAKRIAELEEIDLVLLGVGPDAHVASLFPN